MNWSLIGIGLVALTLGTLAYRRIWSNWIRPVTPGHYGYSVGFGFIFMGFAAIILSATDSALAADSRALTLVLFTIGFLSMLTFAMSLFWLPRFLLPGWFKTLKGLE
ncbi:hypothetical protein E3O25_09530 [Cryobacterium sp. TMT1-3]|uniref:Uncharacterized protein n=1 Tax=Cryobacterium luteum TaxID=1424661 RepID=A0A1H8CFL7_9MICO|nr:MULTISPECIES: hypothetical protein [Cryobacterium]TFB89358.1 hypothetical protein E3O10_10900 [Cryobacterium luteum]TFC27348.1 hypothetical protein E3O25_09530 [Cryobacterium sp. TMT1-3]SEM93752.1 hypothetical protein SAMN05216281_102375 [Cryobacterium luteum]